LPHELADIDLDAAEQALDGPDAEAAAEALLAEARRRRGFDEPPRG
jgi:hypothetical protein